MAPSLCLSRRWSLQGKTALVTGGTRGIGRAIVEELAGLGACVYTCGRSQPDLERCLAGWKEAGWHVQGSSCDVTLREARAQLMHQAAQCFQGKLDILVNNVGTFTSSPTTLITKEDTDYMISNNLESSFNMCQLAYPYLKASNEGSIVFISSVGGLQPIALPSTLYSITKGALIHVTKTLACEWSKDGIRVNTVAPGFVRTEVADQVYNEDEKKKVLSAVPMGRLAEPQEVSAVVAFLCMPCSSFCTGVVMLADGGTMARGLYPL